MNWWTVGQSAQSVAAHIFLFSFTLLLSFKADHIVSYSWWMIFAPLWLFHAVVARGKFSLPAPRIPYDRHWAPFHAIVAMPLLVSSELLLCVYLESIYAYGFAAVNLKVVFIPLLTLEIIISIDNFRKCRPLFPEDDGSINDETIWEALPHFWVMISMIFLVAATTLTLLKLCGDVDSLGWWNLFLNFGIAEGFAFVVCTKWSSPMIHGHTQCREAGSSSLSIRSLDRNSSSLFSSEMYENQDGMCSLQDIGGHVMKILLVGFQVLLCMHLEGTPPNAKHIPVPALFSPLFLLQGAGVLVATAKLLENIVLLLHGGTCTGLYLTISSNAYNFFEFLLHGSRLLGWWSTDAGSQEERARFYHSGGFGYNTFCGYPPEMVKKMPKRKLAEEVWRLQAALCEQAEIAKDSQEEYEGLQNEVLCRVCFLGGINVVLLPCRHHVLCSTCAEKCKKCPICRVSIEERMQVYDV